jgi:hypothetical protein
MVKTPTSGAHRGADRRDHWANLKDLFININPLKVADCYFIHMHRRIDSSSSRSDPSVNNYIDLDYSARLHLALQRLSVFNRLPTEGYTQGGRFWVRGRRDQELEGVKNTRLRQVRAARSVTPYVLYGLYCLRYRMT